MRIRGGCNLKKYWWSLLVVFLFLPFASSKSFSLDPCAGSPSITEDATNYYLDSTCFAVTYPKDYNNKIIFHDKYNDDEFDIKLMSLIDANSANLNQKQTTSFASMSLTANQVGDDKIVYISADNKVHITYQVKNGKLKAYVRINDWISNYDTGHFILNTRIHKEDTASAHITPLPAEVDGVSQPLIYEEKVAGENRFLEETLYIGKSFTELIVDPFYQVDYSPDPAIILIHGVSESDPDSDFESILNVTAEVSDSDANTQITVQPEHILFQSQISIDSTESNTTSATYQTKLDQNFTIDHDGTYIILASAELAQNAVDRLLYVRFNFDGQGISEQQWIPHDALSTNDYQQFMTHHVQNLTAGTYNAQIQYRAEDADIVSIRNARVQLMEVDTYFTTYDNTSYDLDTGWNHILDLIFTPSETDDYFVIATGEYMIDDKDLSVYTLYSVDGVPTDDLNFEPMRDDRNDYRPSLYLSRHNFDTSQHNISIAGQEESSVVSEFRNNRITAFTLVNSTYIDDDNEYTTSSATYQNATGLNISVSELTEFTFMAYAQITHTQDSDSIDVGFFINNTQVCRHIFEPKEVVSPHDDMPFFCTAIANLTGTTPVTIRWRAVGGTGTADITNMRIVAFPVNSLLDENKERAAKVKWLETYNSSFDWYLVLNKTIAGQANLSIHAYDDDDNVSSTSIWSTINSIGTYLLNVSGLMDYELNTVGLNYTAFRFFTDTEQNFSEVRLLQIAEDNESPVISNCNLNDTTPDCDMSVELSCIVTDNIAMGNVIYQVNGSNLSTLMSVNNWSVVYNLSGAAESILYDWEYVYATDSVGNLNTSDPALTFTYDCCIEDWQPSLGACLINDSQIKTYTDANSCGTVHDLPVDNGTYQACNYCSADLDKAAYSACYFNGTSAIRNFTWVDLNYGSCCAITGINASDCIVDFSPYNETGFEACILTEQDFVLELDTSLYFDFGIGGLKSDKVYGKFYLNGTNPNATYKCISYVKTESNETIQTNPPYTKRAEGLSIIQKEIEDREYFTSEYGLGTVYWTEDMIIVDGRQYIFGVECAGDDGSHLITEEVGRVYYENVNAPVTRAVWYVQNSPRIVLFAVMVLIGLLLLAAAIRIVKPK